MNNLFLAALIILAGILTFIGFLGYQFFLTPEIKLPEGEPREEKILDEEGRGKEIWVTDGVKHSVPLEELIAGGPAKDGIPSLDSPKFESPAEAILWLTDDEPGVAFSRGSSNRFYPYQILVYHEIVNDTVAGERVLVTYCPLCLTGFVFDPLVKGERVEFGVSGKLWRSNLVMYDRKTESLWPQVLGEAVVGEMTGTRLNLLESDQVRFGEWKKRFPNGEVLSRNTGSARSIFYGSNPYSGYFVPEGFALRSAGHKDTRLSPEAFIFGILVDGKAKAYPVESVRAKGEVTDSFQGKVFYLRHEKDLDIVRMFEKRPDESLERINPFSAFWFSWSAAHPGTELYK